MRNLPVIITLVLGCCCCSRPKTPSSSFKTYHIESALDMESQIIWLDSISDSITIISLETSDEILIANDRKFHLYNNLLFIVHGINPMVDQLSVFDLSGKYLWDIGRRGQGPEEYLSIDKMFFNEDKVYLYDTRAQTISCYTLHGTFVKKIQLPPVQAAFYEFTFVDQNLIAGFLCPGGRSSNSRIYFMNEEGVPIDSISHYKPSDKPLGYSNFDGRFFDYNGKKYIKEGYYDTVYHVGKDMKLYPEYGIHTGKYTITLEDRLEFGDVLRKGRLLYVDYENDHFIILTGWNMERRNYIFIDKASGVARKVRFFYSEETCRHFAKKEKWIDFSGSGAPGVYFTPSKPTQINDGSPDLYITNVSQDNTTWIACERPLNEEDNSIIVLVHLKK